MRLSGTPVPRHCPSNSQPEQGCHSNAQRSSLQVFDFDYGRRAEGTRSQSLQSVDALLGGLPFMKTHTATCWVPRGPVGEGLDQGKRARQPPVSLSLCLSVSSVS